MSRAIQVRVSESIVRTIHVEDGVASPLELLPILPAERMAELLADELVALGFVREGNTCRRTEADGTEVTVDLAASTIAVSLGAGAHIDESIERTVRADIERQDAVEAGLRTRVARELEARVADHAEALRRQVTAQLEAKLADLKLELDRAIGRATISALTEKAGQLGQIESTHEDEAGNVTIRVRL